jgi:hypothetical protein
MSFEFNSQLAQIESEAFAYTSLQLITIPRAVRFINHSAFIGPELYSISIEAGRN